MPDRTLVLYIHPAKGPTKPMLININLVEEAGIRSLQDPDRARIDEMIRQIKVPFPKSQPESNRQGLQMIVAHISSYAQWRGIVIQTEGTIDSVAEPTPSPAISAEQIDKMTKQVQQLTAETQNLRHQLAQRIQQLQQQQTENAVLQQRLLVLGADRDKAYREIALARQNALPANDGALQQAQQTIFDLRRQIADLMTTQAAAAEPNESRKEVLDLTAQLRDAAKREMQQQQQLNEHSAEIERLNAIIQHFGEVLPPLGQPPVVLNEEILPF